MAALTTAMLAIAAAQGASTFLGQRGAANAAKRQGSYGARVGEMNAQLADAQATDAIARGDEAASRQRGQTKQLLGADRAGAAASGIDPFSGSAVDVQNEAADFGALDEKTIRNNAMREAFGLRAQAANYRASGAASALAGANTASAYNTASIGTLLTTGANMYGTWSNRPQSGRSGASSAGRTGTTAPSAGSGYGTGVGLG